MPSLSRPVPLSDEVFPPVLLGSTHKGPSVRVKNTFVDVPLYTPESTKHSYQKDRMWTCPANLSKSLAFEETPEAVVVTGCATETPPFSCTTETPPIRSDVIPPTPSPVHAWELQRRSMPIRIAPLSFDSAKPGHSERGSGQIDTTTWPTLFEHTVADSVVEPVTESIIQCKADKQHDDSDDASSEDECATSIVVPPQDIPQPPPGALHPSVGSDRHALGACRRCCFFPRGRCMNGYDCEFCHYEHDKRKRKNKTKKRAEAAVMRLAPRATMHAAQIPCGASIAHPSWMFQSPHSSLQHTATFACGPMAASLNPMLTPTASLMGHRAEVPVTYPAPMMMQHQTRVQQFVVYGTGPEPSLAVAGAAAAQGSQQFGRQVIQLPPAVSEQANTDAKYQVPYPSASTQELDFEHVPPPPPPSCSPNLPLLYGPSQQHPALPPPSASPRLTSRDVVL